MYNERKLVEIRGALCKPTLANTPRAGLDGPGHASCIQGRVIPSPHMLVLATSERFLPARGTFRTILTSEPLVATNAGTHHSLVANTSRCGEGIK